MKIDKSLHINIPYRLRQRISKILFWFSSKYSFKSGLFKDLRGLLDAEKKSAAELLKYYDIPKGIRLDLLGFRLTEIYVEDEIPLLIHRIEKAFPDRFASDPGFIRNLSGDSSRTGSTKVGTIANSAKHIFGDKPIRLNGIRGEIDFIEITFYKFLPSVVGVSFDVYMTEEAKSIFWKILSNTTSQREITLTKYYPLLGFFSFVGLTGQPKSYQEAANWINFLLVDVSRIIHRQFPGYLYGKNPIGSKTLPTIEIYSINPPIRQEKRWIKKSSRFLNLIGVDTFALYKNRGILFCWGGRDVVVSKNKNHKVIISPELFLDRPHIEKRQISGTYALATLWYNLSDWFPYFASIYLFEFLSAELSEFKKAITRTINRKKQFGLQFHLKLLSKFQQNYYLLRELDGEVKNLTKKMTPIFDTSSILAYVSHRKKLTDHDISKEFAATISWFQNLLLPKFAILDKFYSEYISLLNTGVTYNIAIYAIFIAILSMLLGIVLDYSAVINFIQSVFDKPIP